MATKKTQAEIEFKVINSQFKSSVKEMNSSMSQLRSEFKLNESQYKATGDKADYLKGKHTILNKEYETQKEKVKATSDALAQAEKTMGENSTEAQKLKTQLNYATAEMYDLQAKTKDAKKEMDGFNGVSENLTNISTKAKGVSEDFKAISASAAAIAAASVAAFTKVDEGHDIIIRKTGATGTEAKKLTEIYKNVGTSVGNDLNDIGTAIGALDQRFKFHGKELEENSRLALRFASVNSVEVGEGVRLVSRAMGDAGIKSSEYANVLDLLTVASQKSGITIDVLATNMSKYGAPMRALGLSTKESIALFAGWEKAGVTTEIAFSGMKKAISNWGAAGKDSTEEFKKTLQAIKDCPDLASATTLAIDIFGAKAGPDLADAIKGGRFEIDEMTKALDNSKGALNATAAETVDGKNKFKTMANTATIAMSGLGETIMEVLTPAFEGVSGKLKDFSKWWDGLDGDTKNFIATSVLVVASISGLALGFSGLCTVGSLVVGGISKIVGVMKLLSIENLKSIGESALLHLAFAKDAVVKAASTVATGAMTIAQGAWNVMCVVGTAVTTALGVAFAFLTSPIGLVVLAIGAVIAIGVLLWQNWETISAWATQIFKGICNTISSFVDSVVGFFSGIITFVSENWQTILGFIINPFGTAFDWLYTNCEGVRTFVDGFVNGVKDFFVNGFNSLKDTVVGIFDAIGSAITAPIRIAKDVVKTCVDTIAGAFNFKWSLPSIKMPHFSVKGSINPIDWITQGIPKFSVKWYAKGGLFTQPTVFANGFGEAGPEYAIPLNERSVDPLAKMIVERMSDNSMSNQIERILSEMELSAEVNVYTDGEKTISKKQALRFKKAGAR